MKNRISVPRLIAITLLLLTTAAQAATVTVISTADNGGTCPGVNCTLRQAVATAATGDTVVFQIPTTDPGYNPTTGVFTITLTGGEVAIGKNLTIDGAPARIVVRGVQSVAPYSRAFNITAGTVRIANLTIANGGNQAGGGGAVRNTGSLTVQNCTLRHNSSTEGGGAIYNDDSGKLTVTNCTLVQNNAQDPGGGGGIYNLGSLMINNSTLSLNDCGGGTGGGIANADSGTVRVRNTIIAGNSADDADGVDVSGAFISDGYNFIGRVDSFSTGFGVAGSHDQVGSNAVPANPKLGVIQDNGGPTATMRPLAGSLAIDQGSRGVDANNAPISADQRGYSRPIDQPAITEAGGSDGSDIGAVEVGLPQTGATLTVTNTAERDDGCTTDDCTLLEAMNAANAETDANTITFAPNVRGSILNTVVPGGLNIVNPMTISGPGARLLTISGNNVSRLFNIVSGVTATISGLTIANANTGTGSGGGVSNLGMLTLEGCAVLNNSGGSGGGAVNSGNLDVINCTFAGNQSTGNGGALRNAGTLRVTNSTFNNNTSVNSGAISSFVGSGTPATVTLTNCTVSGNKATAANGQGGGLFNGNLSTTTVRNTIVVFNSVPNVNNGPDAYGSFSSGGHNMIRESVGNNFVNGFDGDLVGGVGYEPHPSLASLQNNGGPTDTMALRSDSDALDKGNDLNAPPTDQRGYVRSGTSDIGAFEFNGFLAIPPSVTTGPATEIGSTAAALTATVNPNGLETTVEFLTDFGPVSTVNAGDGTANVLVKVDATGLAPNTTYHFRAVASSFAGTSEGAEQTFTTLPGPRTNLGNLSTRLRVETGDDALFAGMIVSGTQPKRVIIRGTGTSLNIADKLANPTLELHGPSGLIEENDNWMDSPSKQAIIDSGVAPSNDLEPAIIATLPAGNSGYTAILRGVSNGTGIGVIEVYDLDPSVDSTLANVSTRGLVQTGDNVLFAGTIVVGPGSRKVIVRAIGPSLSVSGKMADPVLQLFNQNGDLLEENDNWMDSPNKQAILDSTIPPSNDLESAIVATLPGNNASYTAIVRGVNNSTGIALVEVYALQ